MLYDKVIVEIKIAQENKMACQTIYVSTNSFAFLNPSCNYRPLFWDIIDLRAENVSLCPKHPHAKELLLQAEVSSKTSTNNH